MKTRDAGKKGTSRSPGPLEKGRDQRLEDQGSVQVVPDKNDELFRQPAYKQKQWGIPVDHSQDGCIMDWSLQYA